MNAHLRRAGTSSPTSLLWDVVLGGVVVALLAAVGAGWMFGRYVDWDPLPPLVQYLPMAGLAVILLAAVGIYMFLRENQRRREVRAIAEQMGDRFSERSDADAIASLSKFQLIAGGTDRRITNVIMRETPGGRIAVFDYQFSLPEGDTGRTVEHAQTVMHVSSRGFDLPEFSLRGRHQFEALSALLRARISVGGRSDFHQRYVLCSRDDRTRQVFDRQVLRFFESQHPEPTVEAAGRDLIYYFRRVTVEPARFQQFMRVGAALVRLFGDETGNGPLTMDAASEDGCAEELEGLIVYDEPKTDPEMLEIFIGDDDADEEHLASDVVRSDEEEAASRESSRRT